MENQIETKFELTQEQIEAFEKIKNAVDELAEQFLNAFEIIKKVCRDALEIIRAVFVKLARTLLLERKIKEKIPYWIANFIAQNIYWVWACKWGFGWLSTG